MLKESVKFGHLMIEDERILYIDDDFLLCTMDSNKSWSFINNNKR
jgi:hypothetical protein